MNTMKNRSLLARDKFMSEMHLKQPGFTYVVLVDYALKLKEE